jgi:hypothetical protein
MVARTMQHSTPRVAQPTRQPRRTTHLAVCRRVGPGPTFTKILDALRALDPSQPDIAFSVRRAAEPTRAPPTQPCQALLRHAPPTAGPDSRSLDHQANLTSHHRTRVGGSRIRARPIDLVDTDRAAMLVLPPVPPRVGWFNQVRLGRAPDRTTNRTVSSRMCGTRSQGANPIVAP